MPGFVLEPLGNPDDIRREAAANTPPSPIAAVQEEQAAAAAAQQQENQPVSTPAPVNQPESESSSVGSVVTSNPLPQQNSVPQPQLDAAPIGAFAPSGPAVQQADPSKVAPKTFDPATAYPKPVHEMNEAEKIENQRATYVYNLPVGVYIIATIFLIVAGYIGYTLLFSSLGSSFISTNRLLIIELVLLAISGAGLLKASNILRWVAFSTSAAGAIYYTYSVFDVVRSYSDITGLYGGASGLLGKYLLAAILLLGGVAAFFIFACIYLTRPGVKRAFR